MCCYPFLINADIYNESCNSRDDLSGRTCVLNKIDNVNLNVLNMIASINESKTLTKHISSECKFDGRKCNSDQKLNDSKCRYQFKNPEEHHVCKEGIFGILVLVKIVNV